MMDSQENALNQGTLDEQKPNQNASEIKAIERIRQNNSRKPIVP